MAVDASFSIRESQETIVDLGYKDRDALLDLVALANADGSERLRCSFEASGTCKLYANNVIGVLELPTARLSIRPKINSRHFSFLVSRALGSPKEFQQSAYVSDGMDFLELIAMWFLASAEATLRDGLPVSFVEQPYVASRARGRLRVGTTLSEWSRFRYLIHSDVDELSVDITENRLLKSAAWLICSSELTQNREIRRRARSLHRELSLAGDLQRDDLKFTPSRAMRSKARTAVDLALRLLRGRLVSLKYGEHRGSSFLLPTPHLMEEALRSIVRGALSPTGVTEGRLVLHSPNGPFTLNPDLVISNGRAVGDVKYKVWDKVWNRDDVAQSVFFATGYRAEHALILAFAAEPLRLRHDLVIGNLPVTVLIWNASIEDPRLEADRFISVVRSWWEGVTSGPGGPNSRWGSER